MSVSVRKILGRFHDNTVASLVELQKLLDQIPSGTAGVTVTSADTTPSDFSDKLNSASGIIVDTVVNPGGDEEMILATTVPAGGAGTSSEFVVYKAAINGNTSTTGRTKRRIWLQTWDNTTNQWFPFTLIPAAMLANTDGLPVWWKITGSASTTGQAGDNRQSFQFNTLDTSGSVLVQNAALPVIVVGPFRNGASGNLELWVDATNLAVGVTVEAVVIIEYLEL